MRVCGWCLLGNHWHLVLWPRLDGDLSAFMRWTTLTHVQRFHASQGAVGIGHLYQGRETVTLEQMVLDFPRHFKLHLNEIEQLIAAAD